VIKILKLMGARDADVDEPQVGDDFVEPPTREEHSSSSAAPSGFRKPKTSYKDEDNIISLLLDDAVPRVAKKKAKDPSEPFVIDLT
jgi:hypothetical protein